MTDWVALLHSIVLAPGRRVVMSDLRDMASDLGFGNPRTLVSTGNLVFEAGGVTAASLEQAMEAAFRDKFGKHVDIIVRSGGNWRGVAAKNPFRQAADMHPDQVGVRVMRHPISADGVASLQRFTGKGERLAVVDGDLWFHFSRAAGQSRCSAR